MPVEEILTYDTDNAVVSAERSFLSACRTNIMLIWIGKGSDRFVAPCLRCVSTEYFHRASQVGRNPCPTGSLPTRGGFDSGWPTCPRRALGYSQTARQPKLDNLLFVSVIRAEPPMREDDVRRFPTRFMMTASVHRSHRKRMGYRIDYGE